MKNAFYTSVDRYGNLILFRGYANGIKKSARIKYQPTLFVADDVNSKYKTLQGQSVRPIKPGTMRDCMEYLKRFS